MAENNRQENLGEEFKKAMEKENEMEGNKIKEKRDKVLEICQFILDNWDFFTRTSRLRKKESFTAIIHDLQNYDRFSDEGKKRIDENTNTVFEKFGSVFEDIRKLILGNN